MSKAVAIIVTLYINLTGAIQFGPGTAQGDPVPQEFTESAKDILQRANQNPTLTRSVRFRPFEQYWPTLPEDSALRNSEWTWRVNVSDISVPDAEPLPDNLAATTDPHIVSTTFDFSWAGTGNISSALGGAWKPFCWSELGTIDPIYPDGTDLPVNITNSYTEDDTQSSSCVPILGQACVDQMLSLTGGAIPTTPNEAGCGLPARYWTGLPACASTFGYAKSVQGYVKQSFPGVRINFTDTDRPDSDWTEWTNGSGFYGYVTGPVNGTGSASFHAAANQLRVLMINANLNGADDDEILGGPDLLCMRVNATELPEIDGNGDGYILTGEAVLESSAKALGRYLSWAWAMLLSLVMMNLVAT